MRNVIKSGWIPYRIHAYHNEYSWHLFKDGRIVALMRYKRILMRQWEDLIPIKDPISGVEMLIHKDAFYSSDEMFP